MTRPWFPFYVGDYVRDTARLSTEAHGAYLLLMLDYWVNGAPPDDNDVLATITKLPVSIWRKRRAMLAPFFDIRDGKWMHKRIEKERSKAETVGSSNSDKARDAADRRWTKERERKRQAADTDARSDAPSIDIDAPSINGAMLQNAQSQPQSHPEPKSEKGESHSRSQVRDDFREGEGAKRIDESYEPSDRAVEYAYSLGMKKTDLAGELSKFIATSMATRAVSFNIDMSFKVWCDRWLEFKRKRDPNWKPEQDLPPVPSPDSYVLIVQGTPESAAWDHDARIHRKRPLLYCKQLRDGVEVIAARRPTLYPPGYDEASGERLATTNEERVA